MNAQRDFDKARSRLEEGREAHASIESEIAELERQKVEAAEDAQAFAGIDGTLQSARAALERLLLVVRRRESELAEAERDLAEEQARVELENALSDLAKARKAHARAADEVAAWLNNGHLLRLEERRAAVADAEARVHELLPEDSEIEFQDASDEPGWDDCETAAALVAAGPWQPNREAVRGR